MEERLRYLKKAWKPTPAYEEPYFFSGNIRLQDGQSEQAARYLKAALERRPDNISACVSLGKAGMDLESLQ